MANKDRKKLSRGGTLHYRELQRRSIQSRIHRHLDIEFSLDPGAQLPFRKRETDAGFDLFALENVLLWPRKLIYLRTGTKMSCPPGYFYFITGRSGLTRHGIICPLGTVDACYTGEILVPLLNTNKNESFKITQGDRIAQAIFLPILSPRFVQVENFTVHNKDHRGPQGFGSSGR